MTLKSYFASDVKAALSAARRELGPEAMLVESRPSPPEARHLGDCEVVVGLDAPEAERAGAPEFALAPAPLPAGIAGLQRKLERVAAAITRASLLNASRAADCGELAEAFASLVENEVDPEMAHEVMNGLRSAGVPASPPQLERALRAELGRRIKVDSTLGCGEQRKIVALVGPCATGKTTTLVKLAVLYGLTSRRPTQILTTDCYRVAAAEQLRSYAAILGVPFQALETPLALSQALEEYRHKDLILIDTPGFGARDMEAAADLARFIAARDDVDTHLVLTASTRSADLSRVVDRFEIFRPRKLLFTKLDETEVFGPILNEAARTGKPVSFLAAGQQIPEDLAPATVERILDLLVRQEQESGACAAA